MSTRRTITAAILAVGLSHGLDASAQARRPQSAPAEVTITAALKATGGSYDVKGPGTCTHAPKGSIYGIVSQMWSVRHEAGDRSMQLTYWKPTDGSAPMFTLTVNGGKRVSISTVRGGKVTGSGTVALAASGAGGTFTIDATGAAGERVTGTLQCSAFTAHRAEGGN